MNKLRVRAIVSGVFILLLLAFSNKSISSPKEQLAQDIESKNYSFLTWYNGWHGHSVWGVGQIIACFTCGSVMCGNVKVSFTVTYDSHTNLAESKYSKEQSYAAEYNSLLAGYFKKQGQECKFELISNTDNSASNKQLQRTP